MRHLAIFDKNTVEKILSGEKTFELRLSKRRIPPFCQVKTGDVVMVKVSGGKLIGQFRIGEVGFFENPKQKRLLWVKRNFAKKLCLPPGFWKERIGAKFLTLMEIATFSCFLTPPTKITKQDRRGWVVLG